MRHGFALDCRCRRVEAERFIEDGSRIRKMVKVFVGGCPSLEHPVQFLMKPCLRFRVSREEIPCPVERRCGGLVACDKDGQCFIPQLLVSQSLTGHVIPRMEEHAKEV